MSNMSMLTHILSIYKDLSRKLYKGVVIATQSTYFSCDS